MDMIKIGKFISTCRKEVGLTQLQLAEKLNVTDRAVSKWETGKAMPDSSLMLKLCETLNISVNELLNGEKVSNDEYKAKYEQKLLEMIKQKQDSDKMLLKLEVVIGVLSVMFLLVGGILAAYLNIAEYLRIIIVLVGLAICLVGIFFACRIEQKAGYYKCKQCKHTYVPTFKDFVNAPHMGRTRYMKCPNCGKKSWQKKVINK